jgi:hypothetical protein
VNNDGRPIGTEPQVTGYCALCVRLARERDALRADADRLERLLAMARNEAASLAQERDRALSELAMLKSTR